jgi:hypothetical protein
VNICELTALLLLLPLLVVLLLVVVLSLLLMVGAGNMLSMDVSSASATAEHLL